MAIFMEKRPSLTNKPHNGCQFEIRLLRFTIDCALIVKTPSLPGLWQAGVILLCVSKDIRQVCCLSLPFLAQILRDKTSGNSLLRLEDSWRIWPKKFALNYAEVIEAGLTV